MSGGILTVEDAIAILGGRDLRTPFKLRNARDDQNQNTFVLFYKSLGTVINIGAANNMLGDRL